MALIGLPLPDIADCSIRLVTDEATEVTKNHFFNPIVTAGLPPILVSLFTGM